MNVSSFSGVLVTPFISSYNGTKAFMHNFSLALYEEVYPKYGGRFTVTSLCPNYTESAAIPKAGLQESNAFKLFRIQDQPDRVGRVGYRSMMSGKRYALVGWTA